VTTAEYTSRLAAMECTPWCTVRDHEAAHDPACWGPDRVTALSLEDDFPTAAVNPLQFDAPRASVYPYRQEPGYREVVKLHLYRAGRNEFRELDAEVVMTLDEARQLIAHVLEVVDDVEAGAR
jgi:hypothetical protein